jgi:hypothetical protein
MADPNPRVEQPQNAPPPDVVLDEKHAHVTYANYFRVSGTPDEFILDFALDSSLFLAGKRELDVTERLIMSPYTVKRLLNVLVVALQRHEARFGPIEADPRRRMLAPPPSNPGIATPTM